MRGRATGGGYARACDTAEQGLLPQQGAVEPNVIVWTRRNFCPSPATTLGLAQRRTREGVLQPAEPGRQQPPTGLEAKETALLKRVTMMLQRGRRKRQALSTPSTGKQPRGSLPVLILKNPDNPIRHHCAQPDYKSVATLIGARMCVHVLFHRICTWRGRWGVPQCKISF